MKYITEIYHYIFHTKSGFLLFLSGHFLLDFRDISALKADMNIFLIIFFIIQLLKVKKWRK